MNHIFFSLYHDTLAGVILTYKTYLRIVADQNADQEHFLKAY